MSGSNKFWICIFYTALISLFYNCYIVLVSKEIDDVKFVIFIIFLVLYISYSSLAVIAHKGYTSEDWNGYDADIGLPWVIPSVLNLIVHIIIKWNDIMDKVFHPERWFKIKPKDNRKDDILAEIGRLTVEGKNAEAQRLIDDNTQYF